MNGSNDRMESEDTPLDDTKNDELTTESDPLEEDPELLQHVIKYLEESDQAQPAVLDLPNLRRNSHPVEAEVGAHAVGGVAPFRADSVVGANQNDVPPSTTNDTLVVASAINEEDAGNDAFPQAQELDLEQQQERVRIQERRDRCRAFLCIGVGLLVVAIVVVFLVAFLPQKGTSGPELSQTATNETMESLESHVLELLSNISSPSSFLQDTPQSMALEWIFEDPSLSTYPDWRIQQRYILATFYFATEGPGWSINTNWLSYEAHECKWYTRMHYIPPDLESLMPVCHKCISETARAIQDAPCGNAHGDPREPSDTFKYLMLGANKVKGTLPEEIFKLTSLRGINLGINPQLEGTIPTTVALLTDLQALGFILNHKIGGSLPSQIGLLSNLTDLLVVQTPFTGSVPTELGLLKSLQIIFWEFQGSSGGLEGTIPSQIGSLSSLIHLSFVGHTNMTGPIPSQMGQLHKLTTLELIESHISGPVPSTLGLLSNVNAMSLRMNRLSGRVPSELGLLTGSNVLRLLDNQFTGTIPRELCFYGEWDPTLRTGMSFDCGAQLCGCSWCSCNDTAL